MTNEALNPGVPALNATPAPAAPTGPQGTANIEVIADILVGAWEDYKAILPADTTSQKIMRFMPLLAGAFGAVTAFGKIGPEFKTLDATEVKALSAKYGPKFGLSGKVAIYTEEGFNIVASALRIFQAK